MNTVSVTDLTAVIRVFLFILSDNIVISEAAAATTAWFSISRSHVFVSNYTFKKLVPE